MKNSDYHGKISHVAAMHHVWLGHCVRACPKCHPKFLWSHFGALMQQWKSSVEPASAKRYIKGTSVGCLWAPYWNLKYQIGHPTVLWISRTQCKTPSAMTNRVLIVFTLFWKVNLSYSCLWIINWERIKLYNIGKCTPFNHRSSLIRM